MVGKASLECQHIQRTTQVWAARCPSQEAGNIGRGVFSVAIGGEAFVLAGMHGA